LCEEIHESINQINGKSELFSRQKLENFKFQNTKSYFLLFLPDFVMNTPIHYLLDNDYYETFNNIFNEINSLLESFLSDENFLQKLFKMFTFIYENETPYHKTALKRQYCYLTYDCAILSSYDDNHDDDDDNDDDADGDEDNSDDEIEKEMEKANVYENKLENKTKSFSLLTRKNVHTIEKFFKNVTKKIETKLKNDNNLNELCIKE
jgi:hypothetical protein